MLGRLADNLSSPDCSLHAVGIQERLFSFLSHSSCEKTGGNLMPSSGSWSCCAPTKLHWHQGAGCWLLNLIPRVGMDLDWSTRVAAGISRVAGCAEQSSLWSLVHSHSEDPKSHDLRVHRWHSTLTTELTQAWGNGTPMTPSSWHFS